MRGFKKISLKEYTKSQNDETYFHIRIPIRSTSAAAGYDFFMPYDCMIKPKEKTIIHTGIKAYMNPDEVFLIVIRSSIAFKYNLRLINQIAVIDSDYYDNSNNEGHIMVTLENGGNETVYLKTGMRFAQGIFLPYLVSEDEKKPTNQRKGGMGSTG